MEENKVIPAVKPSKGVEPLPEYGQAGFEGSSDYYMENGYIVFTEAYHLKRGYCCKNACRHCPYGYKRKL